MADVTVEEVLAAMQKLSTIDQLRLIAEIANVIRQKLEAQEAEAKPFPSLASDLYEIAQDLEQNPPDGDKPI
jgi:hypothetical protein